jgi:hypothetical protein
MKEDLFRRYFLSKTAAGLAGMAVASRSSSMSAASYKRGLGRSDSGGKQKCPKRVSDAR